jgi:carnitine O-palmitoyltransferase 2
MFYIDSWFDKSLSLIMTARGNACVNFEHSWVVSLTIKRYIEEVFEDSTKKPVVHPSTAEQTGGANVRKLGMKLCCDNPF